MKKTLYSLIIIATIFSSCASSKKEASKDNTNTTNETEEIAEDTSPEEVEPIIEAKEITFFHGTWAEALALAKKENKLIFLDAYASWCGPCKQMSRNVFSTEKAGQFFNKNFINIKIDMEKGDGPILSSKFGVTAYPTLLFIDQNEKVVKHARGYHNINQLIELGQSVL